MGVLVYRTIRIAYQHCAVVVENVAEHLLGIIALVRRNGHEELLFLTEHGRIISRMITVLVNYFIVPKIRTKCHQDLITLQIPHKILAFGVTSESSSSDIHAEE